MADDNQNRVAEALSDIDLDGWFEAHGRDLPWRRTRDPWAIVVAELMLQQTQVARVVERWHRFLDRFPTHAVCADAPVADVIDEWSGLGYNRRALFLHRMATSIEVDHGGIFPTGRAELLALPGIGPYTARAIRVFAFHKPDAVVDTNVARILARTGGAPLKPAGAQAAADAALGSDPWKWNQAMLDVGAGWCTARNPDCGTCPFRGTCHWYATGCAEPDPAIGSAGVSGRQSTFRGSDRQGRGRLIDALRRSPISDAGLAAAMGWPNDQARAHRVAAGLVAEGMVEHRDGGYRLPTG